MGKFVYFTSAEKRQANEVDLPSFLLDRGEKLIMAGRDYRLVSDHSITVRGPMWYDHAARKGGRAISFVQQFYDKTYPEAVTMLLGRDGQGIIPIVKKEPESREPKPFTLPEAYLNMRRLYAYLTTHRRIDRDVVTAFVREKLLYEDALHHNCVFVGMDEHGVCCGARMAKRRTTLRWWAACSPSDSGNIKMTGVSVDTPVIFSHSSSRRWQRHGPCRGSCVERRDRPWPAALPSVPA